LDFTVFGIEAGGKFLFSIAPTFVQFSCSVFFFFQTTMALLPTSVLVLFLGLLICITIEMLHTLEGRRGVVTNSLAES
jgi:hypothetical protein